MTFNFNESIYQFIDFQNQSFQFMFCEIFIHHLEIWIVILYTFEADQKEF